MKSNICISYTSQFGFMLGTSQALPDLLINDNACMFLQLLRIDSLSRTSADIAVQKANQHDEVDERALSHIIKATPRRSPSTIVRSIFAGSRITDTKAMHRHFIDQREAMIPPCLDVKMV